MSTDANTIQKELFSFDGKTYEPEHDQARLTGQMKTIFEIMRDCEWRTLDEISDLLKEQGIKMTTQSLSARLRDLRKRRFGAHAVDRRRRGDPRQGIHEYCVRLSWEESNLLASA